MYLQHLFIHVHSYMFVYVLYYFYQWGLEHFLSISDLSDHLIQLSFCRCRSLHLESLMHSCVWKTCIKGWRWTHDCVLIQCSFHSATVLPRSLGECSQACSLVPHTAMSQTLLTPSILLEEKTKYKTKIMSINFSLPTTNTAHCNVERMMEKGWDLLELNCFVNTALVCALERKNIISFYWYVKIEHWFLRDNYYRLGNREIINFFQVLLRQYHFEKPKIYLILLH